MTDEISSKSAIARPAPRLFVFELATFAAIFWADWAGYVPLSKTPFLFVAAWIFMVVRGVTWRSVGLRLPANWSLLLVAGVVAGVGVFLLEFFGTQQLIFRATGQYPDLHEFDGLVGNIELLGILLAANLVLAAFGEEMVWRGYALPRVASVLGGGAASWVVALLFVNAGFGLAHLYQGFPGVIEATIGGVLYGAVYLLAKRNLIVPMAAHFTSNTIDFTLMYLGLYPGVGS